MAQSTPSQNAARRAGTRGAWMGARTQNVLRRRTQLAALSLTTFAAVFALLLLLPAGLSGVRNLLLRSPLEWRDTVSLLAREEALRARFRDADSVLLGVRDRLEGAQRTRALGLASERVLSRRDSLASIATELDSLIARANDVPLPESYRALATSQSLREIPRVRALADSLANVEREREEVGGGVAVDPIVMALTTRANAIGRSIQAVAEERRASVVADLVALPDVTPVDPSIERPDTVAAAVERGVAERELARARRELIEARASNAATDSAMTRLRERSRLASLPTLIGAALIIGVALAFGAGLLFETRSPRIAELREIERLTGARVLAQIRPREIPADLRRRAADRELAPLLDPTYDPYRMLAWHIVARAHPRSVVVLTSDRPHVAATLAANAAAVLANEARAVLLVDAGMDDQALSAVLRERSVPGLSAVVTGRRQWAEVVLQVPVGRGRVLDLLPSGTRDRFPGPAEEASIVEELQRASRRYDVTLVVAPTTLAPRFGETADVIICATLAHTRLTTLARTATSLRDGDAHVLGTALWEGPLPTIDRSPVEGGGPARLARAS
jgi:Mrp family chromosome partitioning ATPase